MKLNFNKKCVQILFTVIMLSGFLVLTGCGSREAEFLKETDPGEEISGLLPTPSVSPEGAGTDAEDVSTVTPAEIPEILYVDVCGAVVSPGVYKLEAGSRVFQAVEAAGGFLPEAAENYLNQAKDLSDGQQIYVPTQAEVDAGTIQAGEAALSPEAGTGTSSSDPDGSSGGEGITESAVSGKINLNTADAAQLTALSGIGESKARAIVAYREEHGSFASIEDICNVSGIGDATFAKIKDKIAVE